MKKEQSKINISSGMDKIDAYMVPNQNFIHDSYYVSCSGSFHQTNGYGYRDKGPGFDLGVKKKLFRATGEGYMIDSCGSSVGKSDE